MGCAGRVANGISTVHLSYVREATGHALIGARQWVPAEDIADPVKSLVTGLPLDLRFRTKGQLGIDVLDDAYADGLAFDFVCGDKVRGSCTQLREFLEDRGQAYVWVSSSVLAPLIGADFGPGGFVEGSAGVFAAAGGLGGAEPVGLGAGLEDVGVEGDPVDDGGDEAGSGKTVPHSLNWRFVPMAIEALLPFR